MKPTELLILLSFAICLTAGNALAAEGCLQGDCYNGHGTYQWPSGNQYTGTFKDGSRNGEGVFTFINGDKYIGEYMHGKRNGTGIYFFSDGSTYEGEYIDDTRNGFGIFTFPNGARYEGKYKDDVKSGHGKFTFPDGSSMNGNWEKGAFVEPVVNPDNIPSQKYPLTINPLPTDSKIKFIDSSLVYEPGVELSPGRYKIEISHIKYNSKVEIIDILNEGLIVPATLKLSPHSELPVNPSNPVVDNQTNPSHEEQHELNRNVDLNRDEIAFDALFNNIQQGITDQELSELNQQRINTALQENESAGGLSIIENVKQEIEILNASFLDPELVSVKSLPGSSSNFDRIALVIGNSRYPLIGTLKNPEHDARDIAAALRELNFKVTIKLNVDQEELEAAISQFGKRIKKDSLGLFYYAGHGVQVNGNNYLLPVHSGIKKATDIRYKAVDLNLLVDELSLAGNGKNIIILDSCRNNPLPGESGRSSANGLARTDAPAGTLIAYATSPGSVAIDGDGRNGIYTKYLLANIFTPGIPIELVFKRVLQGVAADTGRKQIPWMSSSLDIDFNFAVQQHDAGN